MPKYCIKCGKQLEEGKPCVCGYNPYAQQKIQKQTAATSQQQTQQVPPPQQQQSYYQVPPQQQVYQNKPATDHIFHFIGGLFKTPYATIKQILIKDSAILGLELISFLGVVGLIITFLIYDSVNSSIGSWVTIPIGTLIFLTLVLTFGSAYLLAGFMLVFTKLFGGSTTYRRMSIASGTGSFFMAIGLAAGGILTKVNITIGIFVIICSSIIASTYEFKSCELAVKINDEKIIYVYSFAKMATVLIICLLVYFICKDTLMTIMQDSLGKFTDLLNLL